MENNGISVDRIKIEVDTIFKLLLGSNTNPPLTFLIATSFEAQLMRNKLSTVGVKSTN